MDLVSEEEDKDGGDAHGDLAREEEDDDGEERLDADTGSDEFKPIKHPLEPPDDDRPAKFPLQFSSVVSANASSVNCIAFAIFMKEIALLQSSYRIYISLYCIDPLLYG